MNKEEAKAQAIHFLYGLLTYCREEKERGAIKHCIAFIETEVKIEGGRG